MSDTTTTPAKASADAMSAVLTTTDSLGRLIRFARPDIITKMQLFEVLDPDACRNPQYLGNAMLASVIQEIDGVAMEAISDRNALFRVLRRCKQEAITAVGNLIYEMDNPAKGPQDAAGNAPT